MRINQIKLNDIANGDGISISIWTQGCPHHCKGCFNSDTWSFGVGDLYTNDTFNYICNNIDNNNINRNLSVLGGEALCEQNVLGVLDLCRSFKAKYPYKKIYLWTGYTMENFSPNQWEVLKYVDILIDGKFEIDNKDLNLYLRGSSNQRVIDVAESFAQNKIILY